ncbi:hypothetical protein LXT21_41690 [Myxococcus sp. K38C18041901]|uniref:hypothetical protein n=1 Tax=Myxococcus guangdongensis TaxID=2906760 RepID=UPI0020A70020|nr:hypothetical protein [Myxococcus guangdongensis]MCP3065305.1 hypothetical protein [Myxococcus guangdongensis]
MSAPSIWQYRLRTEKGAWLADVILRSDGFFATVSDWGNYACRWSSPGCPFREFVARLALSPDYVSGKLESRDWYDGEGTLKRIREYLLTSRRERSLSKEDAAKEWRVLAESLDCFTGGVPRDALDIDLEQFGRWYHATSIADAAGFARYDYPPDVQSFAREVMPALAVAIRAELAAEQQAHPGGAQP